MVRTGDGESTLSRVVRILEAFGSDRRELGVSEIARRSGLHVATASRLVEQLVGFGLLERTPARTVRVGVRLWELAPRASPTLTLRDAALPYLEDLHAVIGHHAQLGILDGEQVLFVERLSTLGAVVNYTRVAGRLPLHASSSGLVAPGARPDRAAGPGAGPAAGDVHRAHHRERRPAATHPGRGAHAGVRGVPRPHPPGGGRRGRPAAIRGRRGGGRGGGDVPNDDAAFPAVPALQAAARGIGRTL